MFQIKLKLNLQLHLMIYLELPNQINLKTILLLNYHKIYKQLNKIILLTLQYLLNKQILLQMHLLLILKIYKIKIF
jgi:hypothetical protein